MRTWVNDFLLSQTDDRISRNSYLWEIGVPLFAYRRLASLFRTFDFTQRLTDTFGWTLSDLPFEIFEEIRGLTNLYFFYESGEALGSVQEINFARQWEFSIIKITISQKAVELNDFCLRGLFAHELAHLHSRHYCTAMGFQTYGQREKEADDLCKAWGFRDEIESLRSHLKPII